MDGTFAPSNGALPINSQLTQLKILCSESNEQCAWANIVIEGSQLTVSLRMAEALLNAYPSLAQHACKSGGRNGDGDTPAQTNDAEPAPRTFGDHLIGALLPHAAEHLAIELLVRAYPGEVFAGNTCWVSREEQSMRVRLSLPKSGESTRVLDTLSNAIGQLNGLLASCQTKKG